MKRHLQKGWGFLMVLLLSLPSGGISSQPAIPAWSDAASPRGNEAMFIQDEGQSSEGTSFRVWNGTADGWRLEKDAIWVIDSQGVETKLTFDGANPEVGLEPFDRKAAQVSFFLGDDPSKWRTSVPVWGGVRYVDLYPGLDLEVSGSAGSLAWRFNVRDERALRDVRLSVDEAESLSLDGSQLKVKTAAREFSLPLVEVDTRTALSPRVEGDTVIAPFASPEELSGSKAASSDLPDNEQGLINSTFLGGSLSDEGNGIALDAYGNVYIAGTTQSPDFRSTISAYQEYNAGVVAGHTETADIFVARYNQYGVLEYATFVGGSGEDAAADLAVTPEGSAFVTGYSTSTDFPITTNAMFPASQPGSGTFVFKLDPFGSVLRYSTFLGGGDTRSHAIAVSTSGEAYVTGESTSGLEFTGLAFDKTYQGRDAFLAMINPSGTFLDYSTLFGGSGTDVAFGLAIDSAGVAYITGSTESADLPKTYNDYDLNYPHGDGDAFIAKINPDDSTLLLCTYLGGTSLDIGRAIAVDPQGSILVTGQTSSYDFPLENALDPTFDNYDASHPEYTDEDIFITKISSTGGHLVFSTYFGGISVDRAAAIGTNEQGDVFVYGYTESGPSANDLDDLKVTQGAYDTSHNGYWDTFLAWLSADGSTLKYSTYLGGKLIDDAGDMAVSWGNLVHLTGSTESPDFPTTGVAEDPTCGMDGDCNTDGFTWYKDAFFVTLQLESQEDSLARYCQSPTGAIPTIQLSRSQGCSGISVDVIGTNFPYNPDQNIGTVEIRVDDTLVTTAPVDENGSFSTSFTIPTTLPGGEHTITASDITCSDSQASASLRTPRTDLPIVFIPGVSGSILEANSAFSYEIPDGTIFDFYPGEVLWLDGAHTILILLLDQYSHLFDPLFLEPDGRNPARDPDGRTPDIRVGDILWEVDMRDYTIDDLGAEDLYLDIYQGIRQYLLSLGYVEGETLFYFPYDWRKDLTPTADMLDEVINSALAASGKDKVVLIAHSMGGLVARNYLINKGTSKVDQVITIGTPYLGSPKVAKVLELGDNWAIAVPYLESLGFQLDPLEVKNMSQNFGAAYELVPPEGWFNITASDLGIDPRYIIRTRMETVLGLNASIGNVTLEPLDYDQTHAFLSERHNASLLDAAETFHAQGIADLSYLTDEYLARWIIGTDLPTIGRLVYSPRQVCTTACLPVAGCGTTCVPFPEFASPVSNLLGDGTVPLHSAMGYSLSYNDERYFCFPGVEHVPLPGNSQVDMLLGKLLQGEICSINQIPQQTGETSGDYPAAETCSTQSTQAADVSLSYTSSAPAQSVAQVNFTTSGTEIMVVGTADLHLYDSVGNHTGPSEDVPRLYDFNIPGVDYEPVPGGVVATVPAGIYTIKLDGSDAQGAAMLRIGTMEEGKITQSLVFETIPTTLTTEATVTVDTRNLSEDLMMNLKYDETTPEEQVGVLSLLTGEQSQDLLPPVTTVSVGGANMVTIVADDGPAGSGVYETLYSTEDVPEYYQEYTDPFQLPEGATKITAMSTDRAGNTEYPSAVLDLSGPPAATVITTPEVSGTGSETRAQGFPWLLLLGVGLAVLVLVVILILARRNSWRKKNRNV
jgi:pimeloyl-ACP methyl ester carboxylesterase